MSRACACDVDGFCARYQREMIGRLRQICRGENIVPEKAEHYRREWATMSKRVTSCAHLGEATGEQVKCGTCPGGTKIKVFACGIHGACTIAKPIDGIATCAGCPQFAPRGAIGGTLVKRFDEANLGMGQPGKRFNPSLIEDPTTPGGYLLAYRDGWAGSEIHLIRLGTDFSPAGEPWRLHLRHNQASYGREDPRLFMHNGRLHIAYIGVVGRIIHTSVLYAQLTEDCSAVEQLWYPHLPSRQSWEKNWGFFSHGGELFAIYSVAPHRILRVVDAVPAFAHETPCPVPWQGGVPRGGAAPVLVGDEWWHFFHDRTENGLRVYRTGLYTFENKPPFRIKRYIPEPILTADATTRPSDQYAAVVFTCGAVKRGGDWILSSGIHDRWTELTKFSHVDLESKLVSV